MKQVLVGIFAHPDDEAFGPSGTLLKFVDDGSDLHLILMTDGEGGTNPGNELDLGAIRLKEWRTAAELLGATSAVALHFPDGELTSTIEDAAFGMLQRELARITKSYDEPIELSFMTLEPAGITEHVDHVTASRLTTKLFESIKATKTANITSGKLWYFCLSLEQAPITDKTAYYVPRGREDSFITHKINVGPYLVQKYHVMNAHTSQRADAEAAKKHGDRLLSTEHFQVIS